jgi:hypothetical protein
MSERSSKESGMVADMGIQLRPYVSRDSGLCPICHSATCPDCQQCRYCEFHKPTCKFWPTVVVSGQQ